MVVLCVFQEDDDSEDEPESRMTRVHQAHSELATFQTQCAQKLFKKARRVLSAMKGVVESFSHAGMKKLSKHWQERVTQFSIVHKTSSNRDALAYAHFNFSGAHRKSPKEVSESTKAARRCGEALRGGRGSSSDSSASNSSPEKRRNKKSKKFERSGSQQFYGGPKFQHYPRMTVFPPPPPRVPTSEKSCYTCKQKGHLAKDCGMKGLVKKEG